MTHYVHPTISAYTLPEGPEMSTLPPLTLPQNTVAPTVAFVSPNSSPRETPLSPPPMFSPLSNMSSKIDDVPISSETNTSLACPVHGKSNVRSFGKPISSRTRRRRLCRPHQRCDRVLKLTLRVPNNNQVSMQSDRPVQRQNDLRIHQGCD
jgi:hypothetical protein